MFSSKQNDDGDRSQLMNKNASLCFTHTQQHSGIVDVSAKVPSLFFRNYYKVNYCKMPRVALISDMISHPQCCSSITY